MVSFSSSSSIPLSLLLILLSATVSSSKADQIPKSIYDVLRSNGLPIGLLPKGVINFIIDLEGNFEVHLDQPCNAKFENQVHYDKNITGTLSYGQIGALSGVSAQELFLWFPVKGIRVDIPSSGLIYFDVGVIYKQFSLSLFETPPDCKAADRLSSADLNEGKAMADAVSKLSCRLSRAFSVYERKRILTGIGRELHGLCKPRVRRHGKEKKWSFCAVI